MLGPQRRTSRSSASPRTTTPWSPGAEAAAPQGRGVRHPHAAALPARGDRRLQGDPQAPPRHRRRHPVPVRRPRLRHRAALRGRRRLRLPPQGPHRRGRSARAARSARSPPAARCSTRRSSTPWCARPCARATSDPPTRSCCSPMVAEGKPIKAIAAARKTTPAAVTDDVERLFASLADERVAPAPRARCAACGCCTRRSSSREEQGESLSRLLPGGVAEQAAGGGPGASARPSGSTSPSLMCDIRGYSTIAEHADPSHARRPAQHAPGRDEPGDPRRGRHRDAVRRRRGDGGVRGARAERRPRRSRPGRSHGHARAPRRR